MSAPNYLKMTWNTIQCERYSISVVLELVSPDNDLEDYKVTRICGLTGDLFLPLFVPSSVLEFVIRRLFLPGKLEELIPKASLSR